MKELTKPQVISIGAISNDLEKVMRIIYPEYFPKRVALGEKYKFKVSSKDIRDIIVISSPDNTSLNALDLCTGKVCDIGMKDDTILKKFEIYLQKLIHKNGKLLIEE